MVEDYNLSAIEIAATQMYAKPSRRVIRLRGLGYNRGSVPRIWYLSFSNDYD